MKKILMFISSIVVMLLLTVSIDAQASQKFMTEDDARYFLSFIYNCNYEYNDIKNDQYFKMLTGKLEDETIADEIKLSFLTTMQAQINNNIDKSSYNCDILRSDLQSYLEEKAAVMKDLPEQEYNAFLNKQLEVVKNGLVDWLCSVAATKAGIYVTQDILENIKLASSCYSDLLGAPQKAIEYAEYVVNGVKAAMLPINEELTGRYSYFSVYLTNRKAYSDDTTFDIIMDYNKLAITQNYPLGTIDWYIGSKDSWLEHIDDIERWADIIIQVENSIEGVSGTTSSGSTATPTPENTIITFTKDTYITDISNYIGYAWNLNGYTVVVDSDLTTNKNININSGSLIVTGNMTYGGTELNIGTGYLIVEGNLTQDRGSASSEINVGTGTLQVAGNYYAKQGTFNAGSGRTEIGKSFLIKGYESEEGYARVYFKMQAEGAYVLVKGDFEMHSFFSHTGNITAGTLEIKGDFSQKSASGGYASSFYNFPATGTHRVILSGESKQNIYISSCRYSHFNILESKNPQVTCSNVISVKGGIADESVFDDLKLYICNFYDDTEINVLGNLNISGYGGEVALNSCKLNVDGDLYVEDCGVLHINAGILNVKRDLTLNGTIYKTIINVNNGTLTVGGDLYAFYGELNTGSGRLEVGGDFLLEKWNDQEWSAAILKMQNDKAYMLVNGNFVLYSSGGDRDHPSHKGMLTAGTLEVKGNFTIGGNTGDYTSYSFPATGTHKVILSGESTQNIYIYSHQNSHFNILESTNPNVVFEKEASVKQGITDNSVFKTLRLYNANIYDDARIEVLENLYISGDFCMKSATLNIKGSVNITGTGKLAFGTANLNVIGNFVQQNNDSPYGVYVENGQLIIGGNYISTGGVFNAGSGITKISGDFSISHIGRYTFKMQEDNAYILVNGDFDIDTSSNSGVITAGVLEVKGDFTQHGVYSYSSVRGEYSCFLATGMHKVILSGEGKQIVSFDAPTFSYFNILVNKNPNAVFQANSYKYLFTETPYIVNLATSTSKGTVTKILDSTVENSVTTQVNSLGALSKNGCYFKGWYLDKECTIPLTAENDIIKSDMTLYAKWAEPMGFNNVSYSANNSEVSVSVSLDKELESQNGIVIIAVYDKTKLITIHHENATETVSHTFENIPITENGYIVNAFCWSDLENIIPLCESISTTVQ